MNHPFGPGLPCLTVRITKGWIPQFFQFLQKGFSLGVLVGCSIRSLLCDQLGLDEQYVSNRITTIILDGRPVDDIDSTIVRAGSTLSLSAALPGLVGAAMRRGGTYASLRGSITAKESGQPVPPRPGILTLKLFNMVMKELGPSFLERGIVVATAEVLHFFKEQPAEFWRQCGSVALDGAPMERASLREGSPYSGSEWTMLSVVATPANDSP